MLMFAGQLGCEALNFVLKRIVKEERPKRMWARPISSFFNADWDYRLLEMLGKGYGMPSSHSQFMAYFAVYAGLFLIYRHNPALTQSGAMLHFWVRVFIALVLCIGAGAVAISRVYLNYHTPRQILAGCGAGVVCAFSWFFVTRLLRIHGWVDWALDLEVVRFFRVRDLVVSEDLVEAGWQRWEAKRKLKRKGVSDQMSSKSK